MIAALVRAVMARLLISCISVATPAHAEPAEVVAIDRWSSWGTTPHFARDRGLPGGTALRLAARGEPGEDWSSGAGLPVPFALKAGEQVTAALWARSERPAKMPATIVLPNGAID